MKKILLFVAVVSAFSFASCKKDRTCTCTSTDVMTTTLSGASGSTSTSSYVYLMTKAKKGDAKKACVDYTTTDTQNFPAMYPNPAYSETTVSTTTCKLN